MTEICTACEVEPPFVRGMTLCSSCLRAKVHADRAEREARWARHREKAAEAKALRDWQKPLEQ
jgi:hypothetical protein